MTLGTATRPARIAVIGAGPAGFYTVEALLKQKDLHCVIDLFNRFPTPYGLVREGVAPDHESIKSVTRVYEKLADDPRLRYFGNVTYGQDLRQADLAQLYDMVVYAVGAQTDRRMNIPGEDLIGSYPATIFVAWYNGHPDYAHLEFDLSCERAVVVGNGNVAMDVARILARDPESLARTDIADYALEALRKSRIKEVVMLGRRGPAQAAYTNPEIKEFGELESVDIVVDPADLELDPETLASIENNRVARRNVEIVRGYALKTEHTQPRRLIMRFLVSPVELMGDEDGKLKAVRIEKNRLYKDSQGVMRPKGTGEYETFEAGLIFRSVGYQGLPLPEVPFDTRNAVIPNQAGRVLNPETGSPLPGQYCVGWIKRGPSGVIGTNKPDAVETVKAMLEDMTSLPGIPDNQRDPALIEQRLRERGVEFVSFNDWRVLDRYEVDRGMPQQRPRAKVTAVGEMLNVIRGGRSS